MISLYWTPAGKTDSERQPPVPGTFPPFLLKVLVNELTRTAKNYFEELYRNFIVHNAVCCQPRAHQFYTWVAKHQIFFFFYNLVKSCADWIIGFHGSWSVKWNLAENIPSLSLSLVLLHHKECLTNQGPDGKKVTFKEKVILLTQKFYWIMNWSLGILQEVNRERILQ